MAYLGSKGGEVVFLVLDESFYVVGKEKRRHDAGSSFLNILTRTVWLESSLAYSELEMTSSQGVLDNRHVDHLKRQHIFHKSVER